MPIRSDNVLGRMSHVYGERTYAFTTIVRHNGSAIALAMDDDRRIVYAVLDHTRAVAESEAFDAEYWPAAPRELDFPAEIAQVGFGVVDSRAIPVFRRGSRRMLPRSGEAAAPLEAKLPRLDIDSNYELLRQLEPYLAVATWQTSAELQRAVESALAAAGLEELLGNSREITGFMEQYLAKSASEQGA